MIKNIVDITASDGIHARPAATLVKSCSKMDSDIHITHNGNKCSAKSMMAVLRMGIKKGSQIELEVAGGDESQNMQTLMTVFNTQINI